MINAWEKDQQDSIEWPDNKNKLKSIQEMLHEQSSFNNQTRQLVSFRIKLLILRALIMKNGRAAKDAIKNLFYRWYANTNIRLHKQAIDKIVTRGKISTFQFLYLIKTMAKKEVIHSDPIAHPQKHLLPRSNGIQLELNEQQKTNKPSNYHCTREFTHSMKGRSKEIAPGGQNQISINHIIIEAENELSCADDAKPKESISQIGPPSGLRLELISCANLFENSTPPQNRKSSRFASLIEIARIGQKLKNKLLFKGFRKLIQNALEHDYEEELLKARRNLEVVEENFMVECEIEALSLNYQEQAEHLDSIDKNIQGLKQKFLCSQASSLVKMLVKIFYPQLVDVFSALSHSPRCDKLDSKVYQIWDVCPVSLTSLSNKTQSNRCLGYEKQFETNIRVGALNQNLQSSPIDNQYQFDELSNHYSVQG